MKKVLFVLFVAAMAVATSCRNQQAETAAPADAAPAAETTPAPAPAEAAPAAGDTTAPAPAAH